MARRFVDSLSGVGEIYAGEVLLRSSPYQLFVFRDDDSGGTLMVDGHIDITGMAEAIVLAGPQALTLRLEDGRKLQFALADTSGKIVGTTGLEKA
ncbi:MAG TPA: hypothetical protein VJ717_20480 [Gemmatimonadaceae bacterium]|nr:hypothetical protein [Gemmatimonadaceae bacterium]